MVSSPYLALTALREEAVVIPSTVEEAVGPEDPETAEPEDPPPQATNKEIEIRQNDNIFMVILF
jgi:hypothetical protein